MYDNINTSFYKYKKEREKQMNYNTKSISIMEHFYTFLFY